MPLLICVLDFYNIHEPIYTNLMFTLVFDNFLGAKL
jgi:hypothetical protein